MFSRRKAKDFPNATWSIDKAIMLCMDFRGMPTFCKDNPNIIFNILAVSTNGTLDREGKKAIFVDDIIEARDNVSDFPRLKQVV